MLKFERQAYVQEFHTYKLCFCSHLDDTCRGFFEDALFRSAQAGECEDLLLCSPAGKEFLPVVLQEHDEAFCENLWSLAGGLLDKTYEESDKLAAKESSERAKGVAGRKAPSAVCSKTGTLLPQRPKKLPCFVYQDQGYCLKGKGCL